MTDSTSGESGTIVITASASRTALATSGAPRPPLSTRSCTFDAWRLYPTTSKPALTRFTAIGAPMIPRPMKATVFGVVIAVPLAARGAAIAKRVRAGPLGLYSHATQPS